MSLQKQSNSLKYQTNLQSHTRNKLINNLINKKLSQQKEMVKNRFVKLVKKASQQKQQQQSNSLFNIRKRSSSLKNINMSIDKMKQSILFNSMVNKNTSPQAQFIISRQYKSPIIGQNEIQQTVAIRQKSNLFQVKLNQKDKKGYSYLTLQTPSKINPNQNKDNSLDNENKNQINLIEQIRKQLDDQLWLPGLPHTQILLQNIQDKGQSLKISQLDFNTLPIVKSPVFSQYGNDFQPLIMSTDKKSINHQSTNTFMNNQNKLLINQNNTSNISSKLLPSLNVDKQQIAYDFKKYHKDDYIALQKWFQYNIELVHKKYKNKQKNKPSVNNDKLLLNTLYGIHIGGLQQLIRLNYIESWQKALLFQKLLWSLVRLFNNLMEQQHKINYHQYKLYMKQIKQQRIMYEQRCNKLQIMMNKSINESKSSQTLRKRLSLAYVTYSRVNHQLCSQLQFTHKKLKQLQNSFNYINMKMIKLIQYLTLQQKIKIISDQQQTTYYLIVNKNQKLQQLIKVKTNSQQKKKILKKKTQIQIKEKYNKQLEENKITKEELQKLILRKRILIQQKITSQQEQPVFQTRIGDKIKNIQNQLNKYWLNKQDSLKVKSITTQQLLNYNTVDIGTSTYQKFQSSDYSQQFPQKQQKSFEQYLKQQLQKQKSKHQTQINKQNDLYVSLKQLYEQSYKKIKLLQTKNNQLKFQLQNQNKQLNSKQTKINLLQNQLSIKLTQLNNKSIYIQTLIKQKIQLQRTLNNHHQNSLEIQKKLSIQYQNSQTLVRNNLQLKQKMQKLSIKLKQLQQKLNENQSKKNLIQIQLNKTQQDLDQYKTKYQKLHQNLLKIAPSVDSFLDFKRYDRESIVIASVKKDLEKYFPQYFCKDSDVFLTK